jgi:hypothetical protein
MADPVILNQDTGQIVLARGEWEDATLTSPGASVTIKAGTILAVITAAPAGNYEVWLAAGSLGAEIAKAVVTGDIVTPASGDGTVRALVSGVVNQDRLIEHAAGTGVPIDDENIRQLQDQGITALKVKQLGQQDNQ